MALNGIAAHKRMRIAGFAKPQSIDFVGDPVLVNMTRYENISAGSPHDVFITARRVGVCLVRSGAICEILKSEIVPAPNRAQMSPVSVLKGNQRRDCTQGVTRSYVERDSSITESHF